MNHLCALFLTNLEISLGVGAFAALMALLSRPLSRRYAARWKYWVWLALSVRLLLPFRLSLSRPAVVRAAVPAAALTPLFPAPGPAVPTAPAAAATLPQAAPSPAASLTGLELLALVWLAGAALCLLYQWVGYLHFRGQMLRWGRPEEDPALFWELELAQGRLGLMASVRVLRCDRAGSPLMFGFFRPVLVLPTRDYGQGELRFILTHELTHYKRHDLWYKLLLTLAAAFHWYNPLIQLMVRLAGTDLELSCDSAVTAGMDAAERRAYSEAILTAAHRGRVSPSAFTTYFGGGTAALKERFRNIFSTTPKKRGLAAFFCALTAIGLAGGLVSCSAQGPAASSWGVVGGLTTQELSFTDGQGGAFFGDFTLSLPLPQGWSVQALPAYGAGPFAGYSLLDADGSAAGQVSCAPFAWYPEADNYRAIYTGLMLGSVVNWDNEYLPVVQEDGFGTATCRPWQKQLDGYEGAAAAAPEIYSWGLLAHSTDLLVYIYANFDEEAMSQDTLTLMAQGLRLAPSQPLPSESYTVESALPALEQQLSALGALTLMDGAPASPQGLPLVWYEEQSYLTRVNGGRALVAELDYSGDPPPEAGGLYGTFALALDGSAVYSLEQDSREWQSLGQG